TITAAPPARSNSSSASFSFTATEAGSSFACQLDASAFAACTSPQSYSGLANGSHSFQVRATDPAGNTDPSPASYTWTVDLTPPQTSTPPHPTDPSNDTTPSFQFSSSETNSTFQCRLDGGSWSFCVSPYTLSPALAEGSHTFDVRAIDVAGNTDPTPASYAWTVDLTAPDTSITAHPADPSTHTTPTFSF